MRIISHFFFFFFWEGGSSTNTADKIVRIVVFENGKCIRTCRTISYVVCIISTRSYSQRGAPSSRVRPMPYLLYTTAAAAAQSRNRRRTRPPSEASAADDDDRDSSVCRAHRPTTGPRRRRAW